MTSRDEPRSEAAVEGGMTQPRVLPALVSLLLGLGAGGAALAETIEQAFAPPVSAERVPADGFGAWLRTLPLSDRATPVRTHDGQVVPHPARVVALPLVPGDLQQCADSALRLRAEWQRSQGGSPSFRATSGDPLPWARFAAGEQPYAKNNRILWRRVDPATQTWEGWLSAVFVWAGTRSLYAYETRPAATPRPGDVLVEAGSPGHAVVVLDVAKRGDETLLLIGEGFMPAMDFHVELGPEAGWWPWTARGLALPHWPLGPETLRRWR